MGRLFVLAANRALEPSGETRSTMRLPGKGIALRVPEGARLLRTEGVDSRYQIGRRLFGRYPLTSGQLGRHHPGME